MRQLALCAFLLLGPATVAGAQAPTVATAKDSVRCQELIAQLSAGDTTADFAALRTLAAEMRQPLTSGSSVEQHYAQARNARDSLVARAHVDSVLALYYGHVRAHRDAQELYETRGDSTRARVEAAIVRGFIRSIGAAGGSTPETAMPVVSIDEEYVYLGSLGIRRKMQALVKCGDNRCDALTGTDPKSGKDVTYYFRLMWM